MSITIENPDFETMLAEVSASTGRDGTDLLVELLKREQARLTAERDRRIAEGLAADDELRAHWIKAPLIDIRSPDEILDYDENGLPA